MSRLPTPETFSKLSTMDQALILDLHQREIEEQIDGLRSGYMWTSDGRSKAA